MRNRKIKRKCKLILIKSIIILIVIVLLFILLYTHNKNLNNEPTKEIKKNKDTNNVQSTKDTLTSLREYYNNDDIIAEISIPSLSLKEIIVKSTDNKYYLTHDIRKNKSKNGATFLDYRIPDIDNAQQINIYGHNSIDDDTLPFKILEKYQQEDFFKENSTIHLITDKNSFTYKVFAVSTVKKSYDEHMIISYQGEKFKNHINLLRQKASIDTNIQITENDHILILQTCLFNPEKLLLLFAKKNIET